ncbi:MAG: hypothetical protein V3U29_02560, partial [Phycisphaeraceae bacterium]
MTTGLMPTLAIDLIDAIIVSILLISVFGGWIASVLKKINEARNARDSSARPRTDQREPTTRRRLDTLAAPRRAQLKPPPVPSQTEPINLSMAERLQRARAKAEYEQRAKALRAQQGQRPSVPEIRAPDARARAQAELEARRRQEL